MRKILCVIDSLGSGGAQRQMSHLVRGLGETGDAITLFLYHPGAEFYSESSNGENVTIIKARRSNARGFDRAIVPQLKAQITRADVIISFLSTAHIYVMLAKPLLGKQKWLVGERTFWEPGLNLRSFLNYLAFFRSDVVIANSQNQARVLSRLWGLRSKCRTIWNGYPDTTSVAPTVYRIQENRGILIVGRVAEEKNGLRLMMALDLFFRRNGWIPKVKWAGRLDSTKRSENYYRAMTSFLSSHPKLAQNWQWLGEVPDVTTLYKSKSVLCVVSTFEGLPNALCEGMFAGCPVIASDVCDHSLLLGEEDRGLLCNPFCPESICDALERHYGSTDKEVTDRIFNASEFAREHLSLPRMIENYKKLF